MSNPMTDALAKLAVQLKGRMGSRVRNLQVMIQGDGLVLRGRVPDYYSKQLAQHTAMEVSGLRIAANEIEVNGYFLNSSTGIAGTEK